MCFRDGDGLVLSTTLEPDLSLPLGTVPTLHAVLIALKGVFLPPSNIFPKIRIRTILTRLLIDGFERTQLVGVVLV